MLGYHGCAAAVAEAILGGEPFLPSENDHDWLGHGIYFWEANPQRGIQFYKETRARKNLDSSDAAVIGAVIDMGYCLDLSTSQGVEAVTSAYDTLKAVFEKLKKPMPKNVQGEDLLRRKLDCAVINHLHASRAASDLPEFDTVRGIFFEGGSAYPTSGFRERTHVQIAVRNKARIKGVFRVPKEHL